MWRQWEAKVCLLLRHHGYELSYTRAMLFYESQLTLRSSSFSTLEGLCWLMFGISY